MGEQLAADFRDPQKSGGHLELLWTVGKVSNLMLSKTLMACFGYEQLWRC